MLLQIPKAPHRQLCKVRKETGYATGLRPNDEVFQARFRPHSLPFREQ